MLSLLIALWYALTNLLLGLACLRFCSPASINNRAIYSTSFMLGQVIFVNLWLILGLTSHFKINLIMGLSAFIFITSLYFTKDCYRPLIHTLQNRYQNIVRLRLFWKIMLIALLCVLCLLGMASVSYPPIGDAEAFYMVLPKLMAATHRLKPVNNYYAFSQIGLFGELHHAALMAMNSEQAAKFFVWLTGFAVIGFILSLCTEAGVRARGKIIALILLMTSTTYTAYLYDGKVDIFATALGLAACYWALQTNKNSGLLPYILTGLFAGLACIAKFSYIPMMLTAVFLIVLWNHWKSLFQLKTLRSVAILGAVFLVAMLPHFIKNAILFNEPFAPFYFFKSAGSNWTDQIWYTPETIRYILLTYPFALTFGKYSLLGGNLSPLVLLFIPLFLLAKKEQWKLTEPLVQMIVVSISCLVIWMICRPSVLCPRCILPTLLLFIPVSSWCAEKVILTKNYNSLKIAIFFSLIIALYTCLPAGVLPVQTLAAKFSDCLKSNFHDAKCSKVYPPESELQELATGIQHVNQIAKKGDRVFVMGWYTYHLREDLLQCINGAGRKDSTVYSAENKRWIHLFENGFKFLVVQDNKTFEVGEIPPWLTINEVYKDQRTKVYAILAKDSLHKPKYSSRLKNHAPEWEIVPLT
ncbi:glycosyltransferase family 39 protein [Legionella lytica]|uniref:Glycosyltransferase family 39 protein n=1 Tax=Legionella lytica TaxID=96232 RepID=A0ABY4Y7K1_9GAMM|nr:glycosyltransferase family 39 protein [Legionella lytica]USQ13614.1 glycosyltransferase family 39 protein [Legionella lytica]